MRGFRSTLILLVIFLGLAAYIYFVESKKPPAGEEPPKEKVFALEADKITGLTVKNGAGERSVLKKAEGTWQVVEPVQAPADESEVSSLTSALASLEIQRVVDEKPSDLEQYGLAEPRVEVAFEDGGGSKRLALGDKTATGGDLYAKAGDSTRVFLVSGYLDSTFNRTPFDLREKSVLKFDRNAVDRVQIASGPQPVSLAKTGEEWRLTAPLAAGADYGTVEGLIGRLQTAQMKSIVEAEGGDLTQYGLDKPATRVVLGGGSAQATLEIGQPADAGAVYARDASRPAIFTIESSLADELKKPASDYRKKELFEFRAFNATHVEITRGADMLVFEKVKGEGEGAADKWRQVKPAAREIDATKFETFLSRLSNLRADSFVDDKTPSGLQSPVMTAVVRFDDGKKEERVTFGKVGDTVYAGRPGEPGAAQVNANDFDDAVKALDEVTK